MVYFWVEDSGSGFDFWNRFCELLYGDSVKVEPKDGEGNFVPEVEYLLSNISTIDDKYVLFMDRAYDNSSVMDDYIALRNTIRGRNNFYLSDFICFENVLLSFSKLEYYLSLQVNLGKRKVELDTRLSLLNALKTGDEFPVDSLQFVIDYKKYVGKKDTYTIESLSSSILKRLTKGSGYELVKGSLGKCWLEDCCVILGDTCSRHKDMNYKKALELRNDDCLRGRLAVF